MREIEGTLQRLGTDYLDLYIIHRFDYDTPMEETMEVLHSLVKVGKVRTIGASAMYGYQFYNMQLIAKEHGWTPFSVMEKQDMKIVERVYELSKKYNCKMSQIVLAWQWAKGIFSPIIGADKTAYLDDAVGALNVTLTDSDIEYLEEKYIPHLIVGAINQNPEQGVILLDEKK